MSSLPTDLYQSLLLKLVAILELTRKHDGVITPQAKQSLLQAVGLSLHCFTANRVDHVAQTNDFKKALSQAKELAVSLPGGELVIEEQEQVIQMLEELRDRKKNLLARFSQRPLVSAAKPITDVKMEIDSTASTPTPY
ncbi:hypothetical protein AX15_002439 [Amanita polypyramis BW_CC]|nr:hypothetical protein AX15_002439 [Amanita polypyramis BW_CC]